MERVNHPSHYNQHPAGIECIDIIRHYTCDIANALKYLWRAGLKPEIGKEDTEKEVEDLKKALWYIEDYQNAPGQHHIAEAKPELIESYIRDITGHTVAEITMGYPDNISLAMSILLQIGLIVNGAVYAVYGWQKMLDDCKKCIQHRIFDINQSIFHRELEETKAVLNGQAVDGMDYVSKPGCVRETEPEHYDPLNMVVVWGRVYSLTDEVRKKDNGGIYSPCENCDMWSDCHDWKDMPNCMLDESKCHYLCVRLHDANEQQYYREVGRAKYSPKFGTIEVVDEYKAAMLEIKQFKDLGMED